MALILNPRFALLLIGLASVWGDTVIEPRAVGAFVLGAWTGTVVVGVPLAFVLWVLRLRTLGETIQPLAQLPALLIVSAMVLYFAGADIGAIPVFAGGAVALWWLKRKLSFGLLPL